ncbi:DUF2726 domain-containing protein [Sphingomonas sp. BK345]|uniref:DUF2726 domain-containing protein n=1 Tax=Sphingomonas sp. BK345 TaxID=2586980 RepID=UPI00161F6577|nr:DUF2726 domain-containing protein [Sphingomonas sp. BK345]MBB3472582.1 hypothetical protein [Sphingomonas sp. BK345]
MMALLALLLSGAASGAEARRHHRRGTHRPAHHRTAPVTRPTPSVPVSVPVAATASLPIVGAITPAMMRGGLVAALLSVVGAAAGWFHSHRDRRRLLLADREWRRRVAELETSLTAERSRAAALWVERDAARQTLTEWEHRREQAQANSVQDTENQLRFIGGTRLHPKPLLNDGEGRQFWACLDFVRGRGMKVCPQVNMGEFIGTEWGDHSGRAFRSFNSKRVDLLICGEDWRPLIAVEHQGKGHFQGDAEDRDRVKRLALDRAGIGLVETYDEDHRGAVLAALEQELARILDDRADRADRADRGGSGAPRR